MTRIQVHKKTRLYIYQDYYVTAIFTDLMLKKHYELAKKWGGRNCRKKHKTIMKDNNPLYKWHSDRPQNEIAWIYRKRFGAILRTTISKQPNEQLLFQREIVGSHQVIKTEYFILDFQKSRPYISGNTLSDEFALYSLEEIKRELPKFIRILFETYSYTDDKLHPKSYDSALANTIKDKKGQLHFIDFEFQMIGGVDKGYLVYRIVRNSPFCNAYKSEIYAYICELFSLPTKWKYWDNFHKESEKDLLLPPSPLNTQEYNLFKIYFKTEKEQSTKKTKIALQMFGHLRTYKSCVKQLKQNLLDHYDCDIFMHTWDSIDHTTKTWHNMKINPDKQLSPEQLKKEVLKNYPIKSLKMEKQIVKEMGNITSGSSEISLFGIKSMLYSMSEANKLRENYEKIENIKYDFIVNIRPDILLNNTFDINHFLNRLPKEDIQNAYFIAANHIAGILNDLRLTRASDVLFFGVPQVISRVLSEKNLFNTFNTIKKQKTYDLEGPENTILKEVRRSGIKVYLLNFLYQKNFEILRSPQSLRKPTGYKKFIRCQLKKRNCTLYLLSGFLPQVFRLKLAFGLLYKITFIIGRS